MSEGLLPLAGGYNFRDLGGFSALDGKTVISGKLFRADDLKTLTPEDLDLLEAIPLRTVVDFRMPEEVAEGEDRLPASVKRHLLYPIMPGSLNREEFRAASPERSRELMRRIYEELVTDPACIEQYRKFFRQVQERENLPLLFHCSAGKDRTGLAAALILFALGVEPETVLQDYLASNIHLAAKYPQAEVFRVRPEYLLTATNRILAEHGSLENYLRAVLNVDLDRMRKLYLV